jgi:PAS domain S-box-containing protein
MGKQTILIVENDAIIAMRLQKTLESWGYHTEWALSGETALQEAHAQPPDLVLMDIGLDGPLDGIQTAEQLHQRLGLPSIFLTAYADDELLQRARLAEPYGYLIKPVADRELRSTIEMALYKHQMDRRLRDSEERLRMVTDHMLDMVSQVDLQGRYQYVSPSYERILGFNAEEIVHQNMFEGIHPEDTLMVRQLFETTQVDPKPYRVEYRRKHARGHYVWLEAVGNPVFDTAEALIGIVISSRDVSDRKQAEERIQRQILQLRALWEIDNKIASVTDVRISLQSVLEQAVALLHVAAADILTVNPETLWLDCVAAQGFQTRPQPFASISFDDELIGQVITNREAVILTEVNQRFPEVRNHLMAAEGFQTYIGVPLVVKERILGILEIFQRQPFDPDQEWMNFLATLAGQAAIAIDNHTLFANLERSNDDLRRAYDATIEGWSRALDLRDKETEGHTRRVTETTIKLARRMGINEEEIIHIWRGALLHDIGKLGVADSILHKPGPLTAEEWAEMKKHPQHAWDMLAPVAYLRPALDIPYGHHERWDGNGYPLGLGGEQIPLAARIFAIVDVWDALTSNRPYREAWTREKALIYIEEQASAHFDPRVVKVFLELIAVGV